MKNADRPDIRIIRNGAIQKTEGENNSKQAATGNNNFSSKEKRENNLTPEITISPITTNNMSTQSKKINWKKIGAIVTGIATFCTITGLSGLSVYNCISSGNGTSSNLIEQSESSDISESNNSFESGEQIGTVESFGSSVSESSVALESNESSNSGDISSSDYSSKVVEPPVIDDTTITVEPPPHVESTPLISTKPPTASFEPTSPDEYMIFLYSEYSKITIYGENNMTATLNFDADEVSITAYLASGNVDTLYMNRKNSTEWGKKVIFDEVGVHKIVASAVAPDGNIVEGTTKIEVIAVNFDDYNFGQLFPFN